MLIPKFQKVYYSQTLDNTKIYLGLGWVWRAWDR